MKLALNALQFKRTSNRSTTPVVSHMQRLCNWLDQDWVNQNWAHRPLIISYHGSTMITVLPLIQLDTREQVCFPHVVLASPIDSNVVLNMAYTIHCKSLPNITLQYIHCATLHYIYCVTMHTIHYMNCHTHVCIHKCIHAYLSLSS